MKVDIKKRRGKIVISTFLLLNNPKVLMKVFSKMIPYNIHHDPIQGTITYYCVSEDFEIVEDGCVDMEYLVIINTIKNTVKIEKA